MKTLLEIKKSKVKAVDKGWEELFKKLKEYFSDKEVPLEEVYNLPSTSSDNWEGCFLMGWIEAALGIPKALRGKGLVVLIRETSKEYHDKVYQITTIKTTERKEDVINNMTRMDVYVNYPTIHNFLTTTPPWYLELRKFMDSGIFPFRSSI